MADVVNCLKKEEKKRTESGEYPQMNLLDTESREEKEHRESA